MAEKSKLIRFIIVGGSATLIDFGLLFLFKYLGLPVILSNVLSTGIAFCFSFVANKKYTFKTTGSNLIREMVLFTIVTLFGLWVLQSVVINLSLPIVSGYINNKDLSVLAVKLLATVVSTIWNYLLYSRVVFVDNKK